MYTRQEIFDKVWNHFIVGKNTGSYIFKDGSDIPLCMYRNPEGRGCAIGILIPDDEYQSNIEGWAGYKIPDKYPVLFDSIDKNFLNEIQSCHDDSIDKENGLNHNFMKYKLEDVAAQYLLNIPKEESNV